LGALEESGGVQEYGEAGRELAGGLHGFVPDAHGAFRAGQGVLAREGVHRGDLHFRTDKVDQGARGQGGVRAHRLAQSGGSFIIQRGVAQIITRVSAEMLCEGGVREEAGSGVGAHVVFGVHAGGEGAGVGMLYRVQEDCLSRLAVPGFHGGGRLVQGAQFKDDGKEIIHGEGVGGAS